jgi:hypothetical protein
LFSCFMISIIFFCFLYFLHFSIIYIIKS